MTSSRCTSLYATSKSPLCRSLSDDYGIPPVYPYSVYPYVSRVVGQCRFQMRVQFVLFDSRKEIVVAAAVLIVFALLGRRGTALC